MSGVQPCGVECCEVPVDVTRLADGHYRVQHGDNPEVARVYDRVELLVTSGYAPWVREVHAYEARQNALDAAPG